MWVKLDDQFSDHPKVIEAGPLASWLYVCGLTYAARYLTDGYIPAGQVRKLADVDNAAELAAKLVDVGLWESIDGGYLIHDYLEYNPNREDVMATREARAEAGARGGRRKAAASKTPSKSASKTPANCQANAIAKSKQKSTPSPSPSPSPSSAQFDSDREGEEESRVSTPAKAPPIPEPWPDEPAGKVMAADHPIYVYHEVTNRYPSKAQANAMTEQVNDIELWRECVKAWALRGYNTGNVAGMLDWYNKGGEPGNGKQPARQQDDLDARRRDYEKYTAYTEPSEEERDAARLRAAWRECESQLRAMGRHHPYAGCTLLGLTDDGLVRIAPTATNWEWFAAKPALVEAALKCGVQVEQPMAEEASDET